MTKTHTIVALLVVLCCGHVAVAQEKSDTVVQNGGTAEELKKTEQPTKKPADSAEKETPSVQKEKPKPSLTEQFLEELTGKAQEQAGNPLDAIVDRMRAAQQKLAKSETDKETRELQSQIVKDLDELIELLKKQKPPPPKPNQNQSPPPPMDENDPNQQPRGSAQPMPQNSEKQTGGEQKKQQQGGKTNETVSDKARQSNEPSAQQPRSAAEEAARQRMAKDVWGHLPPALRQQLLNVYSEKFLPKYDELVRKYYEALAEQNRKNP